MNKKTLGTLMMLPQRLIDAMFIGEFFGTIVYEAFRGDFKPLICLGVIVLFIGTICLYEVGKQLRDGK